MDNSRAQIISEIRNWDLSKIEAAIEDASKRGSISDEAYFLSVRGLRFHRKGKIAEAEADVERAIELAQAAKDDEVLGIAIGSKAEIFATQSNPEAESLFRRAIELSILSGNLASESMTRLQYGNLLVKEGAPADALEHYEKAMTCGEAAAQVSLRIAPAIGIGLVYFNAGEYYRAIDIWESTIAPARENHLDLHVLSSLMNIADAYLELHEIELAERYGNEAFELAKEINNLDLQASCHKLLASIHHARGNFDLAIEEFEKSRSLFLRLKNWRYAAGVRQLIGKSLVDAGQIEQGTEILKQAVEELLVFAEKNILMETYDCLVKAYQRKGDYQSAFEYYQKQTSLKDEVFNSDFKNRLVTMEKKLEQQRTEASTKLLQTKTRQLEDELRLQATAQATQTELLSGFRDDLRQIVKQSYDPVSALKKVSEQLKTLQVPKLDWAKIEKEFIELHPEFRRTLQQLFPSLTNQELRLCQLLRTGLKSNEAAKLMYVSERGVEQHRLRIRRKMGLLGKESLTEFLAKL